MLKNLTFIYPSFSIALKLFLALPDSHLYLVILALLCLLSWSESYSLVLGLIYSSTFFIKLLKILVVNSLPLLQQLLSRVSLKPLNTIFSFQLVEYDICWSIPLFLFLPILAPSITASFYLSAIEPLKLFVPAISKSLIVSLSNISYISLLPWLIILQFCSFFLVVLTKIISPFAKSFFYATLICSLLLWHHQALLNKWPFEFIIAPFDGSV